MITNNLIGYIGGVILHIYHIIMINQMDQTELNHHIIMNHMTGLTGLNHHIYMNHMTGLTLHINHIIMTGLMGLMGAEPSYKSYRYDGANGI